MKHLLALLLSSTFIATIMAQEPFVTTWKTDYSGSSCNSCITIPTHPESTYDYEVDWNNDGVYDTVGVNGDITHRFGTRGTYTIAIRGDFPRIFFNDSGDKEKIRSVDQWGDIQWESMEGAFYGCSYLNGPATDAPDLSNVTDMSNMFALANFFNQDMGDWDVSNVQKMNGLFRGPPFGSVGQHLFNQDISGWDVSNVTDMSYMFAYAGRFNQDISGWDVSNVTDMSYMFATSVKSGKTFNQDIGSWNVSKVTNMEGMFRNFKTFDLDIGDWDVSNVRNMKEMFLTAWQFNQDIGEWDVGNVKTMERMFKYALQFNRDIGRWDVSNVIDMSGMFDHTDSFNQDIGGWDVSNVTDMSWMFWVAERFNQDLSSWDVSNVTNMSWMFRSADNFNQDISNWKVMNVRRMSYMFAGAENFNRDIGGWDVSNVTHMNAMFSGAGKFNQDISDWDVSNVRKMGIMFYRASSFNQDIGKWNLSSATNMTTMLDSSGLSCENYSSTLIGWANNLQTPNNIELGAASMTYGNHAKAARETLISKGWEITNDSEGSCTVSVEQTPRASITLYPNPTTDIIRLDIDRTMSYRILDSQGREVAQGSTRGTIDVSELPSAVYFVHLVDERGQRNAIEKVVKK